MAGGRQDREARAEQMRKDRESAGRLNRNLISIAVVAVVVALIALGGYAVTAAGKDSAGELVTPQHANDDFGIVYSADVAGAKPVRVTLYEDFLCPGCAALEASVGSFLDDAVASGQIEIEYRPFAFLTTRSTNEYSQRAWNAAACVLDTGGVTAFKSFHDILFANQPQEGTAGPDDDRLIAFAKQAGVTGVDACVKDQTFTPWVEEALAQGEDDGVRSTPTLLVDGKAVQGAGGTVPTLKDIQQAIVAASGAN